MRVEIDQQCPPGSDLRELSMAPETKETPCDDDNKECDKERSVYVCNKEGLRVGVICQYCLRNRNGSGQCIGTSSRQINQQ